MRLYPSITVDLYKPYPLAVLDVPQNNIGRGAMVTLTAGGAVVIPENETVEVYAKKPDGTKVYNTVIVAGNQLQVAFSPQMTVVEGILQVELQMIDSTGNSITTPIFAVRILKSNIDANAITSQDDFQALVDALAEVEEIKSTIKKGDPGEAATIQIGTVTASDPGSNPQVNNSGTEQDAVFDFVFPRGDPGSMWYQGDAITGTSTSGTVFTGSGIENAELNDMYLNIGSGADRGNVYVCTLAGNASTAQWSYKQNIMGPTGPAGTANASSVTYDNESSGLTADNVQEAVDELNQNMSLLEALWTPNTNFSGSAHKIGKKRMIYVETGWLPWTSEKQVAGWTSDIPAVIDSKYAIMMSGSGAPIGICNVDIGDDTVISITPPTDWVSGTSAHIRAWISYYIE